MSSVGFRAKSRLQVTLIPLGGVCLMNVCNGSKAELHDTPKAAVQGAGIGEKSARQGATPDPILPLMTGRLWPY